LTTAGGQVVRNGRRRSVVAALVAFAVYAAVALLANYPDWPGDPNRIRAGDLDQMVWYLAWTPHALLHWQNPFATTWLNYPGGVNLAQNTSVPLLGLLAAPLTLTVSPLASLNLLLWLAFPLSAFSMYLVLYRWVRWAPAAFVGGALYGFSPYVVTQNLDHLNLAFVPLPPLILMCAYEVVRPGATRPMRWGIALGVLIVTQFFISPEIAATSILVIVVSAVILALTRPKAVIAAWHQSARAVLVVLGIVMAGLAYPTWMMTEGPFRYRGPAYPGGVSADLLSSVTPTSLQKLVPKHLATVGSHLIFRNLSENDGYLGIPLILLIVVVLGLCWSNRWIRFGALMGFVTTILSFGVHLVVDNHVTSIPMPWDVLRHLPFADNIIVSRLSLYTAFFVALVMALAMRDLKTRWVATRDARLRTTGESFAARGVRFAWATVLGVLAVGSALSLVPAWPLATAPASIPPFFTSAMADRIPYGSVVLISPYPSVAEVQPQLWQAVAKMRFRIIGGYALVSSSVGSSTVFPAVLQPEPVERFMWAKATGGSPYPAGPVPRDDNALVCELRSFLLRYRVDTVVSTGAGAQPRPIDSLYDQAIGLPSYVGGGASVWFGVPNYLEARIRSCGTSGLPSGRLTASSG
jgi:hypothetical protein